MASRRTYRSVKVNTNNVYNNLSLNDVLCPICRSILVEPVTLPCSHGFCLTCFEGTMANASLCCPLCRVRFSSWHRAAKKDNKIINVNLWQAIKTSFAQHVQNKLDGKDDNIEEATLIRLATPGEIRREYESQRLKEEQTLKKQREADAKASEELIRKIKEEEKFAETVRQEKLRFDEEVARKLAKEMALKKEAHLHVRKLSTPKKRKPLDKYLHIKRNNVNIVLEPLAKEKLNGSPKSSVKKECVTKIMCQDRKLSDYFVNKTNINKLSDIKNSALGKVAAEISDSNDSIENECRYFKPIDLRNIPASKSVPIVKVPAKMYKACTVIIGAPTGQINFEHNYLLSAFARFEMSSPILGTPQGQKLVPASVLSRRACISKRKLPDDIKSDHNNAENINVSVDLTETPIREKKRANCVKNSKVQPKQSLYAVSKRPCIRKSERISNIEKTPEKKLVHHNIENSPNTRSRQKILDQIFCGDINSPLYAVRNLTMDFIDKDAISPPFYGFQRGMVNDTNVKKVYNNVSVTNNNVVDIEDNSLRKKIQEESDLEFARKLQDEFNKGRYSTRSSIIESDKFCKRRQVTLDEIISSRSKIK